MELPFIGATSSMTTYNESQQARAMAGTIAAKSNLHLHTRSRPSVARASREGMPLIIESKLESDHKPSIWNRPSKGQDQRSLSSSDGEPEVEDEEGDYGLNDEISADDARLNGAPALIADPNDPHLANHLSDACLCLARELVPDTTHFFDIDAYMARMQGFDSSASPSSSPGVIVPFLKDKTIFITGATGFLAKVLVEKILRVQPDVKHLYLLIKAKDERGAKRRLKEEILGSALFSFLRCRHGDAYAAFMELKVSAVVGDIGRDGLGIDPPALAALASELDIVVNSAATTTFDERYDYALNLNTKGPRRIMEFARSCPCLQLVMHVSTAFVNGTRKGLQREEAFEPGHSIANESLGRSEGDLHQPDIDVDLESDVIAEKMSYLKEAGSSLEKLPSCISLGDHQKEKILTLAMKELGMERANNFGWQDTYVFTKAMGEMLVDSMRDHLPTVIIRPSVVESSFREPFPGWMEGNRMMDPIIISYGKGQLPGFLVDPNSVLDVVPVDMVANAMLAAMVEHARKPGLEVYQVASSVVNPLVFSNLARLSEEHFKEDPFLDSTGKPIETFKLQLYQNMDGFMDALSQVDSEFKEKFKSTACNPKFMKRYQQLAIKVKEQATYLANLYHPYTFYAGRFDTSKTQQLFANLSDDEKQLFGFDVSDIDWETYIKRIHIPGLRKHVLKGRGSNM